jgi:hypothetical protein
LNKRQRKIDAMQQDARQTLEIAAMAQHTQAENLTSSILEAVHQLAARDKDIEEGQRESQSLAKALRKRAGEVDAMREDARQTSEFAVMAQRTRTERLTSLRVIEQHSITIHDRHREESGRESPTPAVIIARLASTSEGEERKATSEKEDWKKTMERSWVGTEEQEERIREAIARNFPAELSPKLPLIP